MKFEEILPLYDLGFTIKQNPGNFTYHKDKDKENESIFSLQNLNKFDWTVVDKEDTITTCNILLEKILKQLELIYMHSRKDRKDF